MDEMRTFVGRRRHKVWLWLAAERASRRVVAWVLGRRGHGPPPLAGAAPALPPALLVFYGPVSGLWPGVANRPAPALSQGRGPNQHRRSAKLLPASALRRIGAQILLLQQIAAHARGANQNLHRPAQSENHPHLDHRLNFNKFLVFPCATRYPRSLSFQHSDKSAFRMMLHRHAK